MSGLVLEFAGLPGSGKSTIAAGVAEIFEQRSVRVTCDPPRRGVEPTRSSTAGYVSYLVSRPVFAWVSYTIILRSRQRSRPDRRWTTRTWLKRAARLSSALRGPGLRLFDPGISQALWSIGLRAQTDSFSRLASALLERAPLPHLVAVVNASDDAILSRLHARPGSTSRLEQGELAPRDLLVARNRLEEVLGALGQVDADRPRLIRIVNDHGRAPADCALEIADWIAQNHDLSRLEGRA